MFILGRDWRDGYLDYHPAPGQVRVTVRALWQLEEISDLFVVPPRTLRQVWNYIREVGIRVVVRKIASRLAESLRNRRVVAVGVGQVVEVAGESTFETGAPVLFVAPSHPGCVERVVLPPDFVAPVSPELLDRLGSPRGVRLFAGCAPRETFDWGPISTWSHCSGSPVPPTLRQAIEWAQRELSRLEPSFGRILPLPQPSEVRERSGSPTGERGKLSAVLLGMGQYAKATLLPNLPDGIKLQCVHEIDPAQIGRLDRHDFICDTSEAIREDEGYDVYFIASFHHTHAELAARALESGAWVVVEKPLVTTRDQLSHLLAAVRRHPNRLFAGFHMRHNPLWSYAREDLALAPGEPVHYSCIVYEIPVPRLHWYRWPSSGSRIVSNACHWLDHFLFMNGYAEPTRSDLWLGCNREAHISLELENGAVFSMCLTDIGSARIGMQDHVELRAKDVTVKVDNAGRYSAENQQRVIRRKRINKSVAYARMYQTVCRRILDGQPGDSLESIERGAEVMLDLEEAFQREARRLRGRI